MATGEDSAAGAGIRGVPGKENSYPSPWPDNMEEIAYRNYQSGDEKLIWELFEISFKTPCKPSLWDWSYNQNPVKEHHLILAFDGTRLVGHSAGVPLLFQKDGRRIRASRIQNVMVHPDYRRRGVFVETMRRLEKDLFARGIDLLITFPNDLRHSFSAFIDHLDYTHLFDLNTQRVPLKDIQATESSGWSFRSSDTVLFDEADSAFAMSHLSRYHVRQERLEEYLAWRYHPHSGKKYRVLRAYKDDTLCGLAVYKHYPAGRSIDMLEFIFPDDLGIVKAALSSIRRQYTDHEAEDITLWTLPHYPAHNALQTLGLESADFLTHVLVKPLSVQGRMIPNASDFYLSMGDSDVY